MVTASQGLEIEFGDVSGVAVLRARGPLVLGPDGEILLHAVRRVLTATSRPVILDLSGAAPIGAKGMTALIVAREDVRRAGRHLVLLKPSVHLRAMIEQLHLSAWVDIAETEPSAIKRALEWQPDRDADTVSVTVAGRPSRA